MRRTRFLIYLMMLVTGILLAALVLLPRIGINFLPFAGSGSVDSVRAADGFVVDIFAEGLSGPRFIAFGSDGVLYVAERGNDRVVTLPDRDGDGVADEVVLFAENLEGVHSLAYFEGSWYAGLPMGIVRITDSNGDYSADSKKTVYENYTQGQHNTRTVAFLPDGRMVAALGSTCNVCEETDPFRAAVTIFDGKADCITQA